MCSQSVSQRIEQVRQAVPGLRILSAGWEGGDTHALAADDELIEVRFGKAGGMGVVIPQLPLAMMRFAEQRGLHWNFANVVPLFTDVVCGVTKDHERLEFEALRQKGIIAETGIGWNFAYDGRDYHVQLWKATVRHPVYRYEITYYLFEQDDLWGRGSLAFFSKPDGGDPEPELYEVPASVDSFPENVHSSFVSSSHAMAQFQRTRYLIFARAVAALYYGADASRSRSPSGTFFANGESPCDSRSRLADGTYQSRLPGDASPRTVAASHCRPDDVVESATTPIESIPPFHVLVSHDYHAGLAPFFEREDSPIVQLSIGHNLAYQGIDAFYLPNHREANVDCRKRENWRLLKDRYARLLWLDPKVIDDYFVAWANDGYIGTPNWTQAILRKNFFRTGLAMTTVSPGYADEQRKNKEDILAVAGKAISDDRYSRQACRDRLRKYFGGHTEQDDLFVPNQNLADLRKYKVIGILNGIIPSEAHLLHKPELACLLDEMGFSREADNLQKFFENSRPPKGSETKETSEWTRYKERFDGAAGALARIKAKARRELFVRFSKYFVGKEIDRKRPILFAWGRLVSQKGFHIIHEAVTSAKTRGYFDNSNIVVLATAPEGDHEALEIERRLLSVDRENFVFIDHYNPEFRDMCLLAASGALLTPLFEPCGLTDIEAYWFGTPCVVHSTGGLVKGIHDPEAYTQIAENFPEGEPVAESYEYYDNTDPEGEAVAFAEACGRLLSWDPETRQRRQLKALSLMQFTYDIPANRYIDLIQFTWLNQVWRCFKDHREGKPKERLAAGAAVFVRGTNTGFVAGKGLGCCKTLGELYATTFRPLNGDDDECRVGVNGLDEDIELDRALCRELEGRRA